MPDKKFQIEEEKILGEDKEVESTEVVRPPPNIFLIFHRRTINSKTSPIDSPPVTTLPS